MKLPRPEIAGIISVQMTSVVNKSDVKSVDGFFNMSTVSGEGVEEVLAELLRLREELKVEESVDIRAELILSRKVRRRGGRQESETDF